MSRKYSARVMPVEMEASRAATGMLEVLATCRDSGTVSSPAWLKAPDGTHGCRHVRGIDDLQSWVGSKQAVMQDLA